jgi:hypothetical protein
VAEMKGALESIIDETRQLCVRKDLQPYFRKTSCKPEETTPEQLKDKSRFTDPEKAALNMLRTEMASIQKKWIEFARIVDPQNAKAVIPLRDAAIADQDKNALISLKGG